MKNEGPPLGGNEKPVSGCNQKRGTKAKTAQTVFVEANVLAEKFNVNRLVFLTLTFPDSVRDLTEAQRRWHSLLTNVFKVHYLQAILCFERTPHNGLVHLHAVAVPREDGDYKTGFDWEAYAEAKNPETRKLATMRYARSASPCLRGQWRMWREIAPRYQFGRVECLPIRTTAEQACRYVAGYLTKSEERLPQDRGRRLLRFVGFTKKEGGKRVSTRTITTNSWGWGTHGSSWGRFRLAWAAQQLGYGDYEAAKKGLGACWCYKLRALGRLIPEFAVPARFREIWKLGVQRAAVRVVEAVNQHEANRV